MSLRNKSPLDVQTLARDALNAVRAETHTSMNRAKRRKIAKALKVFKYRGLWQGIFSPQEREKLEAKTVRKVKELKT